MEPGDVKVANSSATSFWRMPPVPAEPVSLADVMSEELAKKLYSEEQEPIQVIKEDSELPLQFLMDDEPKDDDFLIAQMLQMQFDREYDEMLSRQERKCNGESKVSISFDNYRLISDDVGSDSDSSFEIDLDDARRPWDSFEESEKISPPVTSKCGYIKQPDGKLVTKHDLGHTNRKNASRVMEFPPSLQTGDGGGFDMRLSNRVYNELKQYARTEDNRQARVHDKIEKSTAEQAVDPKTRLLLFKLVNNGLLEKVNGVISTGKEAVVVHADGGSDIQHECAIKIFKTTLNKFKTRSRYIKDDHRFKDRFSKQNPRKVIHLWAEKEMRNLYRMKKCGILCPEVVALKKHVLVMSLIGKDQKPAPKLKMAILSEADLISAYNQTVEMMCKMYKECNLIHADLSEYNILWYNSKCYFIDVSQSVEPIHPEALEFLYRDCSNISNFFSKHSHVIPDVKSASELFQLITGLSVVGNEAEIISQIREYEINEEMMAKMSALSPKSPSGKSSILKNLVQSERSLSESVDPSGEVFDFYWDQISKNEEPIPRLSKGRSVGGKRENPGVTIGSPSASTSSVNRNEELGKRLSKSPQQRKLALE